MTKNMKTKAKFTLEEVLKPEIWKCAKCGGELHVHKYLWEKEIKAICWCRNCSPKKDINK